MKTKEKVTFAKYDPAEVIKTKEDVIAFLEEAIEENAPEFLLETLGHIARSKGMTQLAKELDVDRKGLYKALSNTGNPSFKTIYRVLYFLGYQLSIKRVAA